jgi:acyl-coenzyme A thioesterase PaaI-like protein
VNDRPPQTATRPRHILQELGFAIARVGDELCGSGPVLQEAYVPGTDHLRTSVLATWTDTLAGLLAAEALKPRVPVTLELDVHLHRPAPGSGTVVGRARTVKRGRSVFVAQVEFESGDGEPLAVGAASFMLAPDPTVRLTADLSIGLPASEQLLSIPLAERAQCVRVRPGTASLHKSDDGLNSSRSVNGGLIALAAEEAALSLTSGQSLSSLGLRYLQAARLGPVVATAEVRHGLGLVELRDAGNEDRLCVLATTRTFGPTA